MLRTLHCTLALLPTAQTTARVRNTVAGFSQGSCKEEDWGGGEVRWVGAGGSLSQESQRPVRDRNRTKTRSLFMNGQSLDNVYWIFKQRIISHSRREGTFSRGLSTSVIKPQTRKGHDFRDGTMLLIWRMFRREEKTTQNHSLFNWEFTALKPISETSFICQWNAMKVTFVSHTDNSIDVPKLEAIFSPIFTTLENKHSTKRNCKHF
jgi:hypothetical protein